MKFHGFEIIYSGFQPSDRIRQMNRLLVERVVNLCPSDSQVTVSIDKLHDQYGGLLRVNSAAGVFDVSCRTDSMESIAKILTKGIMEKINVWKSARFVG